MDRPSGGSVLLGDTEITSLSERELAALRLTRFGFVFQQAHLMPTLCLLDNIVLPGYLAGLLTGCGENVSPEQRKVRIGVTQ